MNTLILLAALANSYLVLTKAEGELNGCYLRCAN